MKQVPCVERMNRVSSGDEGQFKAITKDSAIWRPGSRGNITITFGDYNCEYCSPDAAWSNIGNESNYSYPSMNLGFIDPPFNRTFTYKGRTYQIPPDAARNYCGSTRQSCRSNWVPGATVVHEFGHALGMMHEHQNNIYQEKPIKLDVQQVVQWYDCGQGGFESAKVNVLDIYGKVYINQQGRTEKYDGTKYDKNSIMLYEFPNAWINGCPKYDSSNCNQISRYNKRCSINPTKANFELSKKDKEWLKKKYPTTSRNPPVITVKFVDRNPEPWKVAWVEYSVINAYKDIGIKWIFETNQILGKEGVYNNVTTPAPTPAVTRPTPNGTMLTDAELGSLIAIIILFLLRGWWVYFRK
jgi:hypothetical protein